MTCVYEVPIDPSDMWGKSKPCPKKVVINFEGDDMCDFHYSCRVKVNKQVSDVMEGLLVLEAKWAEGGRRG